MKSKNKLIELPRLNKRELIERAEKFSNQYCITNGKKFKLKDYDPSEDGKLGEEDKPLAKQALQLGIQALSAMQEILYAQDRWSILLIFQAMDAAGKDGAIKHVMSGVNPQGCQVYSFKAPSEEDLQHDFMWRCMKNLPEKGRIGIFNRSYYEEVLVVRVHEELLKKQKIPEKLITDKIWNQRFEDIKNFEQYLVRNGTIICKFFLNISPKEQKKRFLERIDNPDKNWKFSTADIKERGYWKEYMHAYEDMIRNTATKEAPWYVVPSNNKTFSRVVVASAIINALDSLGLEYPKASKEKIAELENIKKALTEGS